MKNTDSSLHNIKFLWLFPAIGIILFYFIFDPVEKNWMPQCVFHKITGLQCMGCGAQRMLHALLHGNIGEAFQANAFLLFSFPFLGFLIFTEFSRLRFPRLYARIHSRFTIFSVAGLLFVWLIVRNIIGI